MQQIAEEPTSASPMLVYYYDALFYYCFILSLYFAIIAFCIAKIGLQVQLKRNIKIEFLGTSQPLQPQGRAAGEQRKWACGTYLFPAIQYISIQQKNKSMKSDTSVCDSVFKSPLNCSTSKACFSFTKAPRSPKGKSANDLIYDLPSMLNARATAIGFGKKVDIAPRNSSPPPNQYQKPSEFNGSPKKGISFGLSRQDIKAVSIFQQTKSPGPGQYQNSLKESSKSYEMRGRDGFPKIFQSMHTPGPGQYEIKQQTDKQFYANSKRKSPQVYSIRKGGKQNQQKVTSVGPGSYETSFASMGRQILGNKKTQKTFCFDKQARQTFVAPKSKIGPGSYQVFSQFAK